MKSPIPITKLTLLAGATLFCAGASWSAPPAAGTPTVQSETVAFNVTQATTPEGAAKLYATLQDTAARVCTDPTALPKNVSAGADYTACVKQAVEQAVTRMRVPMVTMVHLYGPGAAAAAVASR